MSQSRKASLVEAFANMASGMLISYLAGLVIYPMLGWQVSAGTNAVAVGLFTIISLIRSYLWRRFFNKFTHKEQQ